MQVRFNSSKDGLMDGMQHKLEILINGFLSMTSNKIDLQRMSLDCAQESANMKTQPKEPLFWLLSNGIGMCSYFLIRAWLLAPRADPQSLNGIDILFYWLTMELPIILIVLVINLWWLTRIIRCRMSQGMRRSIVFWIAVSSAWAAILGLDKLAIRMLELILSMTGLKALG
jgi:hypothetical protein